MAALWLPVVAQLEEDRVAGLGQAGIGDVLELAEQILDPGIGPGFCLHARIAGHQGALEAARVSDGSWDAIWDSAGRLTDDGFVEARGAWQC